MLNETYAEDTSGEQMPYYCQLKRLLSMADNLIIAVALNKSLFIVEPDHLEAIPFKEGESNPPGRLTVHCKVLRNLPGGYTGVT